MQLIWCLLSNFYLNRFRASLCPSSGEQEFALPHMIFCTGCDVCGCVELGRELCALLKLLFELPHMVFCTGCDVCGCVELGRELCALWKLLFDTARVPAPHNHSHHNQCRAPYAAVHTLVLLMMGIMMPETCWDKSLIINIRLIASCWFLSLHPTFMMHGHTSLKPTWQYFASWTCIWNPPNIILSNTPQSAENMRIYKMQMLPTVLSTQLLAPYQTFSSAMNIYFLKWEKLRADLSSIMRTNNTTAPAIRRIILQSEVCLSSTTRAMRIATSLHPIAGL